jgi:PAS domain S-box-containing protein
MDEQVRVLIVDDEPANRELLGRLVTRQGYALVLASDGAEALAIVDREAVDVVFLDLMMPGLSGLDVLDGLTARGLIPALPVLIVSGRDERANRLSALNRGATDFIPRPFDALEIETRLRNAANVRKLHEQIASRLSDAQNMHHALMAGAAAPITVLEPNGHIIEANGAAESLYYLKTGRLAGTLYRDLVVPDDRARIDAVLYGLVQEPTVPVSSVRFRALGRGGSEIHLDACASLVSTGQGQRIVVIGRDVTVEQQMQTELACAQRLAAVGTLAAGIAHEINTPIQFVNDSLHFLRDAAHDTFGVLKKLQAVHRLAVRSASPAELGDSLTAAQEAQDEADLTYVQENVPKAFDRCLDGLGRVATIVRSMKEFAHPAQKDMAATDLNRAIQNTLTISRNEYKYVAEVRTEFGDLPPVTCHVNDINQVVLNVVVNAAHAIGDVVKGSDRKGAITVHTRRDGECVLVSITDTGGGIPEAVRHRIFEPFFTTKQMGQGTGQGLALAWAIVREKHGGSLTFETTIGKGTTFFIHLPIDGTLRNQTLAEAEA